MESRRLIINADDFGLTPGINRAILELHAAHALTSATLMATGPAFRDAVHAAFVETSLDVGCHVVLVDGQPVLPYRQIPTLATASGFRPTLGHFVADLHRGRIREAEIEAEIMAQIKRLQSSGLTVSHLDTHKHTHIFGRVLRPLLSASLRCGVPAVRNPFEPAWSLRATQARDWRRRMQITLLRSQRGYFRRTVHRAGIATTDGAIGILATGELDAGMLRRMLEAMPPGLWELVCHPGYHDAALESAATRLRASRVVERDALAETFHNHEHRDLALVNFSSLSKLSASSHLLHTSYSRP